MFRGGIAYPRRFAEICDTSFKHDDVFSHINFRWPVCSFHALDGGATVYLNETALSLVLQNLPTRYVVVRDFVLVVAEEYAETLAYFELDASEHPIYGWISRRGHQ